MDGEVPCNINTLAISVLFPLQISSLASILLQSEMDSASTKPRRSSYKAEKGLDPQAKCFWLKMKGEEMKRIFLLLVVLVMFSAPAWP